MPADLGDVLRRERDKQRCYQKFLRDGYQDRGYVFAYEGGRPMQPNYVSKLFKKFIHDNELPPITLHGLRHSYVSIANVKYDIGKAPGQRSLATTSKIYPHSLALPLGPM